MTIEDLKDWIREHKTLSISVFLLLAFVFLLASCISIIDDDETSKSKTTTFNPINLVKAQISLSSIKAKEWKQEKIGEDMWKVSLIVDTYFTPIAEWKISKTNNMCSETGGYVSICSENGWAKTYSNLPYCKPVYICEK